MVRVTKNVDYAIVLLTKLARREPGDVAPASDLARETGLPSPITGKILKLLCRAGLLNSHRGSKGGYDLARNPKNVSVAEIIEAVDGPISVTECLSDSETTCGIEFICPTRANWERVNQAIWNTLNEIPLSEMTTPFGGLLRQSDAQPAEATD